MVVWNPEIERARLRNGTVVSVSGGSAVVKLDGSASAMTIPVYGQVAANQGVLVMEQGGSRLVIGRPPLIGHGVITFNYDGSWLRANLSGWGHTSIRGFSAIPWGFGSGYVVSVTDATPSNFGIGVWRLGDGSKVTTSIAMTVVVVGTGQGASFLDDGFDIKSVVEEGGS